MKKEGKDDGGRDERSGEGDMCKKERRVICRIGGICREEERLNVGMSG